MTELHSSACIRTQCQYASASGTVSCFPSLEQTSPVKEFTSSMRLFTASSSFWLSIEICRTCNTADNTSSTLACVHKSGPYQPQATKHFHSRKRRGVPSSGPAGSGPEAPALHPPPRQPSEGRSAQDGVLVRQMTACVSGYCNRNGLRGYNANCRFCALRISKRQIESGSGGRFVLPSIRDMC